MMWVKQSNYHMTNGTYIIAKYHIRDKVKYGLWRENVNLGYFDSFDAAKTKHEDIVK